MSQKHLIAGFGEVGKAIHEILEPSFPVAAFDKDIDTVTSDNLARFGRADVLHVCFPCPEDPARFIEKVLEYAHEYLIEGGLIIVHSSVPLGTTDLIGTDAVHSPIRGVHPHLAAGIRTFRKYFGGPRADEAARIFESIGIPVMAVEKAETTEALKLLDTTYYGLNIVFEKAVKQFCDQNGLDFDIVYTDANETYNAGYRFLGRPEVMRPVLKDVPGKIGGHCVIPNCKLLGDSFPIAEFILASDEDIDDAV